MEAYNTRFTKGALGLLERCRNDGDPSVAGGEMKLEKVIPSHKKVAHFFWIKEDFSRYTEKWRHIRENIGKTSTVCWWCRKAFHGNQ